MAVPRVYVRRGTTVWSVTNISLTHRHQTNTGRTNIDFFIPLHNRPLKGQLKTAKNHEKPRKTRRPTFRGNSGCFGKLCIDKVFSYFTRIRQKSWASGIPTVKGSGIARSLPDRLGRIEFTYVTD